jgi:hypothetical protein
MRKGSVVLGRRLPLKDEFLHTLLVPITPRQG